ncbi:hypothetical protein [Flavobacterium columnare]|uniref:Uncharacterized protein n=1 Tax=Flavobacterium columnare TaxID=996 RepID=A0AAJ3ZJP3_9FLAO|nr:hypothetical protein [Flavobacterium columnare]QCV57193.1 hypothetical protein UN65_15035 [Flavobacterium columnare]QOG57969.1 hypothetical protein HUE29_11680 [Flavobacterium columnare]QOG60691.1 hypothetical protein HUE30_11680 [Flavobacterium columnare]QOG63411.1 hypothetical protein HUE31_11680 [Flavobacterium columnare]QOG66136.1 hypothetical protein HUE32_11690 [Flavobacterium columnare]
MYNYLKYIPCGESIPFNNPYAVSVSLPTIHDIISYEEGDKKMLEKMQSGYPRFFRNKLVQRLVDYVRKKYEVTEYYLILPISSQKAYHILCELIHVKLDFIELLYHLNLKYTGLKSEILDLFFILKQLEQTVEYIIEIIISSSAKRIENQH